MIPKVLHYCHGFADDGADRPWALMNYVCVMSAISHIRPEQVMFHCANVPAGPWWEITRPHVTLNQVEAPREVFGNPLLHAAHRSDVLRLRTLLQQGGLYLDSDVLVHRDFDDLLHHQVVMGIEERVGLPGGLCNGVILAAKGAEFLRMWHESYRTFRSKGQDAYWGEHSILKPAALAEQHPDKITVLPKNAFHWPTHAPGDLELLFETGDPDAIRGLYANHFWGLASIAYTWDITPGIVRSRTGPFFRWAAPYVADLPDRFGAPSIPFRLRRRARHLIARWRGT
jgi:hypothetical protein